MALLDVDNLSVTYGDATDAVKDHLGSSSELSARESVAHFVNEDGEESSQHEEGDTEKVGGVINPESATDHGQESPMPRLDRDGNVKKAKSNHARSLVGNDHKVNCPFCKPCF